MEYILHAHYYLQRLHSQCVHLLLLAKMKSMQNVTIHLALSREHGVSANAQNFCMGVGKGGLWGL